MVDNLHAKRVRKELERAGMTKFGFLKLATIHLPELIHDDEHIEAVVYGRLQGKMDSVMLVATDKRILFLDYKPLYKNADEITYEVVSGVKLTVIGLFAGVVLHTRVKDIALRYVNINCAEIFTKHIETHIEYGIKRVDSDASNSESVKKYQPYKLPKKEPAVNDPNTILGTNTAVLSTLGENNEVHASVVHYITDKDENYYILTKSGTTKASNILRDNRVALTIHSTGSLRSLLIKGPATIEKDNSVSSVIYHSITSPKTYTEGKKLPPITKIDKGDFVVYKITPTTSVLQDFTVSSW